MRVADMTASALGADQPVLADRVVNDAGNGLALDHDRQHDAEQWYAGREIEGAVDRVDDESQIGVAQTIEQRRIVGTGFLADDHRRGIAVAQPRRDQPLGVDIGLRHQIGGGGLLPDVAIAQPAKAGHDFGVGGLGQQAGQPVDCFVVKCHRKRLVL